MTSCVAEGLPRTTASKAAMHDFLDLFSYMSFWHSLRALDDPQHLVYSTVVAGFFGAAIGSFLTLATYRLPLDIPIGVTRSRCPECERSLRLIDLVPVLSWASTGGKCRYCCTKVAMRYPLTELACAAGSAVAVWHYGLSWEALSISGLWWCIVAIVVTDLEHTIILDEVQLATGVFGILYEWTQARDAEDVVTSAIVGGLIGLTLKYGFIYFRNKDGLGLGDVKFLVVAGIWLGVAANFVPFLFISGVLGIVSGLLWKAMGLGERFPFGPSLALALLICVVWPNTANGFWNLYGLLHG